MISFTLKLLLIIQIYCYPTKYYNLNTKIIIIIISNYSLEIENESKINQYFNKLQQTT